MKKSKEYNDVSELIRLKEEVNKLKCEKTELEDKLIKVNKETNMLKDMTKGLVADFLMEKDNEIVQIQKLQEFSLINPFMYGLYNGLELARCILDDRKEPEYLNVEYFGKGDDND